MRGNRYRGAWLLAACLALAPATVRGQGPGYAYAPADPQLPVPLGSTRPEDGGLFVYAGYAMYRQNVPLKSQLLAVRGFLTYDNTLQFNIQPPTAGNPNGEPRITRIYSLVNPDRIPFGAIPVSIFRDSNGRVQQVLVREDFQFPGDANPPLFFQPGQFVGSGREALNVHQLTGEDYYTPGFNLGFGWRFDDGSTLSLNWRYLTEAQYRAGATLVPINGTVGRDLSDSFLFAPVFNFPPEYSGPPGKIVTNTDPQPSPQVAYGIWNGASIMTIDFRQRFQQWDITYREPIYETEDYRLSGLVGPRFAWIWEKFTWRTTALGVDGDGNIVDEGPDNLAQYTNITSNRMYGAFTGCEQEFYMGRGFACHIRTELTLFMDSVKERAKYELANRYAGRPENKRSKREWTVVPGFNAQAGLMWYPTEFVQIYVGYDLLAFFNTRASPRPIDFDYSNINPRWTHVNRLIDGWNAGIAFTW
jgi:hypothetical protein